jgi:hypothetical protein
MNNEKNKYTEQILPIAENTTALVNAAWIIAGTSLWNGIAISKDEEKTAKKMLRREFHFFINPYKAYLNFCQRILFTADEMKTTALLQTPANWLAAGNDKGYASTLPDLMKLEEIRKKWPLYKVEYKVLAEAVLHMTEEPLKIHYAYWTGWFNERQLKHAAKLFNGCCAQIIFRKSQK